MKLLNFTFIKLTLCLVLGIVLARYVNINFKIPFYSTIALTLLLSIYWLLVKSKISRKPYFGILTYLCFISIGVLSYTIKNAKLNTEHYSHFSQYKNGNQIIVFKILERLKPDAYNNKYIVSVNAYNQQKATGKLLINISRDSLTKPLFIDDVFYTSTELKTIQKPLNPHQFNYSNYLELQQVYHQLYLKTDELIQISNSKTTIYGFADTLRQTVNDKLIKAGFKKDALSIINALLLGQRQTIDKTIYNNYVNSGTIHILAVSGLHVGIVLLILNFIFRPLLYLKYGDYVRPILIVTLLWCFAIIAGLSPSVTRAVTMFSIISIASHLKRPTNIYNTLVISAFVILLFKPMFLFEVGFQMSYLAVLGIVSVQPIIYKLWKPKYWVPNKLWQVFTVTLAAQFGVVPISLFYFHQFPGLFFVSNILVIPFLGLVLGFGLFVIFLALLNSLPEFIVTIYSFVIDGLNAFIAWVAQFEGFLLRDIPFSMLCVICSYFFIVALVQLYKFRNFKYLTFCFIAVISFQSVLIYENYSNTNDAFIVFNKSRYTIIGQKLNEKLIVHHNLDTLKRKTDNVIKNYKIGESISKIKTDTLQHIYKFEDKTILVIDSLGVYKHLTFQPNYVLLRHSPRLNLNRVIDSLQPQQIIADASNYKSYIARWKATCADKKIPFHITNEKGAFVLDK